MNDLGKGSLELALIRWSVRCRQWEELSSGSSPYLKAYLAGWFCCELDVSHIEGYSFRDSFNAGWADCESEIKIRNRDLLKI